MPVRTMKQYLDENGVRYVTIIHSPAYTAAETAATAHVSGREMAKVVMVKLDGEMAMVVVTSTHKVDEDLVREVTGADKVELATEEEFRNRFPDCEVGAMPPFGNLYGMDVFVAADLAERQEIAFNAGSHTELVKMAYGDFEKLVKPKVIAASAW